MKNHRRKKSEFNRLPNDQQLILVFLCIIANYNSSQNEGRKYSICVLTRQSLKSNFVLFQFMFAVVILAFVAYTSANAIGQVVDVAHQGAPVGSHGPALYNSWGKGGWNGGWNNGGLNNGGWNNGGWNNGGWNNGWNGAGIGVGVGGYGGHGPSLYVDGWGAGGGAHGHDG